MQEKEIVLDVLTGVKGSIGSYAKVITETANPQLRQTFQQMRDGDEQFQYQLYQIASQKGYYSNPPDASQPDMQMVKTALQSSMPAMQ
jgi:spore coat protein CotF